MIHDDRRCDLGEGAFWHPIRHQLFWFDILNRKLMSKTAAGPEEWTFPDIVSAMGWISHDDLLIASEQGLIRFNLVTGARRAVASVQAGQPDTRSNDGRADRQGGFWWGTMGKRGGKDPGRGAIWRFHRGVVRQLFAGLTIPNSICFSPDGGTAYFSDTLTHRVMRVALDADGWPTGAPQVFLDLRAQALLPDGATVDAVGNLWLAEWGSGRVACYGPDGAVLRAVPVGGPHSSCPAFGGRDLTTLYVTTALEGMSDAQRAATPDAGKTFVIPGVAIGLPEPQVLI